MIHVYCGDGKGKSTASMGLCVRATGNNIPVLVAQFLKDDTSGELNVLRTLPTVEIIHSDKFFGFTWNMTEEEKKEQAEIFVRMMNKVDAWIEDKLAECGERGEQAVQEKSVGSLTDVNFDVANRKDGDGESTIKVMVILDEVIPAIDCKLLEESVLLSLVDKYDKNLVEFVFTGRNPSEKLKENADYVSCIQAVKHPYQQGITSRRGVEY